MNKTTHHNVTFGIIAFLFLFVWKWTNFYGYLEGGLDPSWATSLNWIKYGGKYLWGKDYFFTYGPLYSFWGHITRFSFLPGKHLFFIQVMLNILKTCFAVVLLGVLIKNTPAKEKWMKIFLAAVVCTIVNTQMPDLISLLSTLLCLEIYKALYGAAAQNKVKIAAVILSVALMLAAAQYVKFSYVYIAWTLLVIMCVLFCYYKRYIMLVQMLIGYTVSSLVLWLIAGQQLQYLGPYFKYCLQISSGYTEGMAISFAGGNNLNDFIAGGAFVAAYIAMLIYLLKKKNWFMMVGAFLITPFIFLGWKEAFVRADGHTASFEHIVYLSLLYVTNLRNSTVCPANQSASEHLLRDVGYILAVLIVIIIGPSLKQSLLPNNELYSYLNLSRNAERYYSEIERNKENVRNQYAGLAAVSAYISADETVDIFPWDISALYVYGLNWVPRPVPQSYSDYTDILDNLTARHFTSDDAPQKILYGLSAIDGRYPAFDEPATFRTVLERYNLVTNVNGYLVLDKSKMTKEPQHREIGTYRAKIGEAIEIPRADNACVYMNIDWKPTLLGKLANFVLRAPLNSIQFTLDDGSKRGYRFIRSPAKNGLFVSTFVGSASDLANVFKGEFVPNINSVTIKGRSWFYQKEFNVSFFSVPLDQFDRTIQSTGPT